MRAFRSRWFTVGAAVLLTTAVLATSVSRVPAGHVGLDGVRLRSPGWTVHRPFSRVVMLTDPVHVELPSVAWKSKEGSSLEFRLELEAGFANALAPQLAVDIRRLGFENAVGTMAEHVLADVGRRTDVETLLSSPAATEAPLRAGLEGAGLQVSMLSFRSRIGDEVVRRAKTEEARRLARPSPTRVLLIGCDGADWNIADPLMSAGRMPNLARMVREGARANLRSYDPMFSPLLWTTVATGKPPTEHGIADFLVRDASDNRRPITSDFRKVKALWNILSDFDRRSTWIGWWASYPAETTHGLLVTDYLAGALATKSPEEAVAMPGVISPSGGLANPSALLLRAPQISRDEVAAIIPVSESEYRTALAEIEKAPSKPEKARSGTENPVAFVIRVLAATRNYHNIALAQLRAGVPFVAVYFEGIDMMGHGFQHFLPPKMSIVSESDYQRFKDAVPNFYRFQDRLLGELLDAAGADAVTVLLSDHGFRTGDERPDFAPSTKGQPEEWHRDWGVIALHGPGIRHAELPPASIYDVTPTVLYLSGLPLADDMPGRLITAGFEPAVLKARPPARLRSYELVGDRLEHAAAQQADPAAMKEMMANLRALGYVGGAEEEALPAVASVPQSDSTPETQYFFHRNLAVSYIRQGRLADAETELLLANERKKQGKTYEMLSQVRARQGKYREAIDALREGLESVPDLMDPTTVLWIVELELLAGDPAAARSAKSNWSTRLSPAVRLAIDGRLREADGDLAGAASDYRRALDSDPLLVRTAQRLHELDLTAGQPFAIEPLLLRALAANPKVDAYWDMAGQIAMIRGDQQGAIARFQRANVLQPDDGLYLGHLASALASAGRQPEALAQLAWADRNPPTEPDAWMALGGAWDRVGDADRAVRAFTAAKNAGYSGPGADLGAALALARVGRSAEALQVISAAETRFPSSKALADLKVRLTR